MIYHGAPGISNALSIMKDGFHVSRGRKNAVGGSGIYADGSYLTPAQYARGNIKKHGFVRDLDGIVLQLPIRKEAHPKILALDDPMIKDSAALKEVRKNAEGNGEDLNDYLAREYGIDIIVNGYIMIQNQKVLKIPKDLSEVFHFAQARVKKALENYQTLPSKDTLQEVEDFVRISRQAQQAGISLSESPTSLAHTLYSNLRQSTESAKKMNSLLFLNSLLGDDPEFLKTLNSLLNDSNPDVQRTVAELLKNMPSTKANDSPVAISHNAPGKETTSNKAPPKFVTVNGVLEINPAYQAYRASQNTGQPCIAKNSVPTPSYVAVQLATQLESVCNRLPES